VNTQGGIRIVILRIPLGNAQRQILGLGEGTKITEKECLRGLLGKRHCRKGAVKEKGIKDGVAMKWAL